MTRLLLALFLGALAAPAPADEPRELPRRARVVDFGDKLGTGFYRGKPSRAFPATRDRDGNGSLDNDSVSAWEFSLETPLNAPGLDYDVEARNAVFYGGLTLYKVNNAERKISEGHTNLNHEFYDDLNFMALGETRAGERFEGYATWFWQKRDFLNGGDRHRVAFDDESFLAVQVSRYWGGVDAGRWLVREGDRFYLSKATFAGEDRPFFVDMPAGPDGKACDGANNPVVRRTHLLRPARTEWAEYQPKPPFEIDFDAAAARFQPRAFTNVTAVGFFVSRRLSEPRTVAKGLLAHQPMAVKWNAFRCDAVVLRPEAPSHYAELLPLPGAGGVFLGRTEVPYDLWRRVWRSAVSRQYCLDLGDLGYNFLRDGAMGSMRADGEAHSPREPATDLPWLDAALFCNALSELEGLEPAYYADAAHTQVLRVACDRDSAERRAWRPAVFWKRAADGFRLPTPDEWARAARDGRDAPTSPAPEREWTAANSGGRTHPVGTRAANAFGFHDLRGNVWEYAWDPPGDSCPADAPSHAVLGGSYLPAAEAAASCLPFAESPGEGSPRIGFRIARGPSPAPAAPQPLPTDLPSWSVGRDAKLPPRSPMSQEEARKRANDDLRFVVIPAGLAPPGPTPDRAKEAAPAASARPFPLAFGATEVPWRAWNLVRNWAEANGYSFNYAGDLGNTSAPGPARAGDPAEPVTVLSMWDAMVWCNALSELMGRRPVYFADESLKEVHRHALPFRLQTFRGKGFPNFPFKPKLPKGEVYHSGSYLPVVMDGRANGFRLPLPEEWDLANRPAAAADKMPSFEWLADNSGGRTHPVGTKPPNALGLHDMEGNVIELTWGNTAAAIEGVPARKGSYFARPYGARHPRLDLGEFSAVGRNHCGFRVVRLPD